jgi:hypothetical protein
MLPCPSVLGRNESSVSSPLVPSLYSEERAPGAHSIGEWVGRGADVDVMAKRQISPSARNRTPIVESVASIYRD